MAVLNSSFCVAQASLVEDACGKLVCLGGPSCEETFPAGGRLTTPASETLSELVPQGGRAEAAEGWEAEGAVGAGLPVLTAQAFPNLRCNIWKFAFSSNPCVIRVIFGHSPLASRALAPLIGDGYPHRRVAVATHSSSRICRSTARADLLGTVQIRSRDIPVAGTAGTCGMLGQHF